MPRDTAGTGAGGAAILTRDADKRCTRAVLATAHARTAHAGIVINARCLASGGARSAERQGRDATARGARKAELVGYATSAEAFGDKSRCVGYAGITISA